jgi:SNF2 family DNA or RNA helicase
VDQQAEDRCHRIGQTKPVTVIKLVCQDTVDECILAIQKRKKELDRQVLVSDTVGGGDEQEPAASKGKKGKKTKKDSAANADNDALSMQSVLASLLT